jgi:glycosyltransferase involved in cell wall biosynthesis
MVTLHYPHPRRGARGIQRYTMALRESLEELGEPVRLSVMRTLELRLGRRAFGGLLSQRVQMAVWPMGRRLLHSTHVYSAHPRADVATVQDCFPEVYRAELGRTAFEEALWRRNLARLVHRGTWFVFSTDTVRQTFLRLHPEVDAERTAVTPYGIDSKFAPGTGPRHLAYRDGEFNILAVSDLNPRKRLDWLLAAVADLEGVRVVHAGTQKVDRPAWQVQADRERPLAQALGDRFVRLGSVPDDELARLYQGADLFVMTSLDEGFGFPPLEALACGTPVLTLDGPVFREVLRDQASYYRDAEALPAAIETMRSPVTQAQRRKRHDWIRANYTWRKTAQRTQQVYRNVEAAR